MDDDMMHEGTDDEVAEFQRVMQRIGEALDGVEPQIALRVCEVLSAFILGMCKPEARNQVMSKYFANIRQRVRADA
jgi:hypothetical protein